MLVRTVDAPGKPNSFNATVSALFRQALICVSVKSCKFGQHHTMMSPDCCKQKAESCETRATACSDANVRAQWLEMAAQWHEIARDESVQATLARLMTGMSRWDERDSRAAYA
jgi:hypothetical protein